LRGNFNTTFACTVIRLTAISTPIVNQVNVRTDEIVIVERHIVSDVEVRGQTLQVNWNAYDVMDVNSCDSNLPEQAHKNIAEHEGQEGAQAKIINEQAAEKHKKD